MAVKIGNDWDLLLDDQWSKPYYLELRKLLIKEYKNYTIYPSSEHIFDALRYVSYKDCKVLILGQDPYHGPKQANGLSFSVASGVPLPPSLVNIYKEIEDDIGVKMPQNGDLSYWAKQGVLLLNSTLTVRAHQANSHSKIGWQMLTDHIVKLLGKREKPMAFLFWGNFARSKARYIKNPSSAIFQSAHPSPLSAYRGFFGSKPFSKINKFLEENGEETIDWKIPEIYGGQYGRMDDN